MQNPMPVVERNLTCSRCLKATTHALAPSRQGCDWVCKACDEHQHAYSHPEMLKTVMEQVFGVPEKPKPYDIPEDLEVYLEYHGPDATEKQASDASVRAHIHLTGGLPQVGKPLFSPAGNVHPGAAIPYAKVVRIEGNKPK